MQKLYIRASPKAIYYYYKCRCRTDGIAGLLQSWRFESTLQTLMSILLWWLNKKLKQWNKAKLWRHIQSWNLHKNIKKMKSRYSEKKNLNFFTLKVMAGTYKYCNIFLYIFVQRDRMSLIIMERSHNKWRHVPR